MKRQLAVSNGTRGGYGERWGTAVRWETVKKCFASAPQTRCHAIHCRALPSSCAQKETRGVVALARRGGGWGWSPAVARWQARTWQPGWDVGQRRRTLVRPQALLVHQPAWSIILLHARATPGIAFDALPCGGHEVSQLRPGCDGRSVRRAARREGSGDVPITYALTPLPAVAQKTLLTPPRSFYTIVPAYCPHHQRPEDEVRGKDP